MKAVHIIMVASIVCLSGCDAHKASPKEICQDVTVKEITSLQYRDATILLSNGKQVDVNQATLKPGDSYKDCTKIE